jgi:hypothetical protein
MGHVKNGVRNRVLILLNAAVVYTKKNNSTTIQVKFPEVVRMDMDGMQVKYWYSCTSWLSVRVDGGMSRSPRKDTRPCFSY